MKKLQLINRIDVDGEWWIVRLLREDYPDSDKHFKNKEDAEKHYQFLFERLDELKEEKIIKEVDFSIPALSTPAE